MVISDGLSFFKALGENGFDHTAIITGGGPESVKLPEFKWTNTIISNVKRSIHGCFHAISENHFSRYLAEYCYRFNRSFDLRQLLPRFCYVALRTKPCCTGKILEIVSRISDICQYFLSGKQHIVLTDTRRNYLDILQKKFGRSPNLDNVLQMDIIDPGFDTKFVNYFEIFDSVYAFNILEYVQRNNQAVANGIKLYNSLVPAFEIIDKIIRNKMGLSVICARRKLTA